MTKGLCLLGFLSVICACSDNGSTASNADQSFTLSIPVNYANPTGAKMNIEVGVRPANKTRKGHILWLAGGPGGNVFDFKPEVIKHTHVRGLQDDYDFVFINIRGVGDTATKVVCGEGQALDACMDQIHTMYSLGSFNSHNFARDIDHVCDELKCEKWAAVYGESYGTRLAAEYARLFPSRLDLLVLDGVLSPDAKLYSQSGPRQKRSLDKVFMDCNQSASCKSLLGSSDSTDSFQKRFDELLLAGNEGEVLVQIIDIETRTAKTYELTRSDLLSIISLLSRSTENRPYIPVILTENRTTRPLLTNVVKAILSSPPFGRFNDTVFSIVSCNESFRFDQISDAELEQVREQGGPFSDGGYPEDRERCQTVLTRIPDDQIEFKPVYLDSSMTACVLNGEDDFITDVPWAQSVAAHLSKAQLTILPFHGHVVFTSTCGNDVVTQCLAAPGQTLDKACTTQIQTPYAYPTSLSTSKVADAWYPYVAAFLGKTDAELREWGSAFSREAIDSGDPSAVRQFKRLRELQPR